MRPGTTTGRSATRPTPKDSTLGVIDNGREDLDAIGAEIGDGERAARHLIEGESASLGFLSELSALLGDVPERALVSMANHRHN